MSLARDAIYAAALAASSPLWGYRLLRTGKWRTDWSARLGRCPDVGDANRPTVLLHAVSVGEVNAIRSLVHQLAQHRPQLNLVISVTTDTGIARARDLFAHNHSVVRFPMDFSKSVERFLDAVRPTVVALVELEVWPNFVEACNRRRVPVCVINGRLSERSFKRYQLLASALKPIFSSLSAAAVQTEDYANRFIELGAHPDRVLVTDSMKWDTAQIADHVEGADLLARELGIDQQRPLIVAGSTGPGEEKLLIDTCPPEAQLLMAPRRPERFDEVAALDPAMVRRTRCREGRRPADGSRLFLLDTIGELRKAYALADVVMVGRSFLGLYGSDPIEPVALNKPVIIGPCHSDFAEIVAALKNEGGLEISNQPGLLAAALLADPVRARALAQQGRGVIMARQGATSRHAELILDLVRARTSV